MNSKNNGGSAFPVPGFEYLDDRNEENPERIAFLPFAGMTLRDYFAAKAMQAMVATPTYENRGWAQHDIASQAYAMADAMLAERAK